MQRYILILAVGFAGALAAGYFAFGAKSKRAATASTQNADRQEANATDPPGNDSRPEANTKATNQWVPKPTIISRQEWKAKEPQGEGKENTVHCITIHHTGMPQKLNYPIIKKLQNLQSYSQSESRMANGKMKPAWFDVPYHFYIDVEGKIAEGREIKYVSDTNTSYDPTRHATIVLEGNFENEQPTDEQHAALQELVAWLSVKYQVPASLIKAHNDYTSTACPGVNLKKTLPPLRETIAEIASVPEKR